MTYHTAVGVLNVALGLVYTSYGVMSIVDLRRGVERRGELHFGLAWVAMAFTCGPHHFEHGAHILLGDHAGGLGDVVAVVAGLPAGATWFALRVEAFLGGRGDRVIDGTPFWVHALPVAGAVYGVGMTAGAVELVTRHASFDPVLAPNLWLVVLYCMIGWYLAKTQLRSHHDSGGWSLSGLSLTAVFPTCALMHAAWVAYAANGTYDQHAHLLVIDWLAVPAALYFVWVVRGLSRGELGEAIGPRRGALATR